jgi:hypothetical protein
MRVSGLRNVVRNVRIARKGANIFLRETGADLAAGMTFPSLLLRPFSEERCPVPDHQA